MILIVGLGNFGKEYENTFHNCGFLTLDNFCTKYDINISKKRCKSLIFEGVVLGKKVVIAKPQTYMNNSGDAVIELKNAYKPDKILVIYDDIDLPIGSVRFRPSGSAGTHNGMRSIIKSINTEDFARIRVGIKSNRVIYNLADYVLSNINDDEMKNIQPAFEKATNLMEAFIKNDGQINATSL